MHAKGVGQWREAEAVCDEISLLEDRLDGAIEESELIRSRESVLGFEHEDFNQAIEMREGLKPFHELWSKVQEWEQQLPEWMDGPFSMIDSENASEFVRQCWRDMYRLQRVFDQNKKYSESLKVVERLKGALDGFKKYLPTIKELRNPAMRPRHWMDLATEMNTTINMDKSMTLRRLLADNILDYHEATKDISLVATKEYAVELEIQDLYATWSVSGIVPAESNQKAAPIVVDFALLDGMSTYAFSNLKSVSAILDEQAILLKIIENSIYMEPFVREIHELDSYQQTTVFYRRGINSTRILHSTIPPICHWYVGENSRSCCKI